jgi:hypothetical protein
MSNKSINFFLAVLLIAMGFIVYAYSSSQSDADAQVAANGTGMLTNPTAEKVANFANSNETMQQAVLNVHAARGINHKDAKGFGAAARRSGGVSQAMVRESEVPAIMKEYRRLKAEDSAPSARTDQDEEEEEEAESEEARGG